MTTGRSRAVQMRGITRQFPGVLANDQVDFELHSGEIHALLGENGAGKTTLMNILCGLEQPDAGEILIEEKPVRLRSPKAAIAAGIGMVHQHFMLVERFTVADNIVLGQAQGFWREDRQRLYDRLRDLSQQFQLQIDPAAEVWQLSVGQQQRVEILKAIAHRAQILILDEPTAVLTPQEVTDLLAILRSLAAQGTSIIFITHKLNEVMAVCDRVTVLRDGKTVGTRAIADCTERHLAELMVGREVNLQRIPRAVRDGASEPVLLDLQGVQVLDDRGLLALQGVDLKVRAGEIVGIAGVDGNGQQELEAAIAGLRPVQQGTITQTATLAHIPSDRYRMGLLSDFSVAENSVLRTVKQPPFSRRGWLNLRAIVEFALQLVQQFAIRTASVKTRVGKLSGGNAQRIILGRELAQNHKLILAAQPTRGLDINAIDYIHNQLMQQRQQGAGILLISTELEEILRLSDRIVVLFGGKLMGEVEGNQADTRTLGLMMAGRLETNRQD
jgi:general nucleoside transport system ATP-binding protein